MLCLFICIIIYIFKPLFELFLK